MGAHYRSIQVKGYNRNVVIAAVESLLQKGNLLIGPEINGWTGIYVGDPVLPDGLAAALAERLNNHVLELMVHDSDIFIYNFYRGAELIDEYSSCPDYFEEVTPAEHEQFKGKPEVFRDLVASDHKLAELRALLDADDEEQFTFEEKRLEKFADLLGIQNTLSSYEYLIHGEWDGIQGRDKFIHIPDLKAEKAAAKAAAAAVRAEIKRLQKEGILCFESLPPGKAMMSLGEVTFDPLRGGILFKWTSYIANPTAPKLFSIKPPWTSEPEPIDLPASSAFQSDLTFSRTGKWFAYCDGQLRLWNWAEQRLIDGINLRSAPVHFSADENTLLCRTQNGFEVLSLQTKEVIVSIRTGTQLPHFLAWHPAGKFVLSRPRQDQIGIIDLDAGQLFKTLYSGTVVDWSTLAGAFSGKLKQAGISDDQLPDMHEGFIRGTDEPFSLKFSPDGRLLFCGTTRGLRVLEWEKVLAAERSTPAPLFSASPLPLQSPLKPIEKNDYTNFIYDVALDENQDRVLFCGTEGTIRFFNLSDKSTGILLKPPTINSIWRLQISPDRKFISCLCTPPVEDRNTKPARIQIWNYQLLRAATGLN